MREVVDWQPIDTLERDGRQVMFWCPAGPLFAPASPAPPRHELRRIHREIYEATGTWPDARYAPTHWAELPTGPKVTPEDDADE